MSVEQRQRRDVAVAGSERDAEGFPELGQLVSCSGGEGPRCVLLRVESVLPAELLVTPPLGVSGS